MSMQNHYPNTAGFTLIELIVSLALFATVSTVAVGSLVVLINNNRDVRAEQALITNVSFALDMMTRDLRTGFDYVCQTSTSQSFEGIFNLNNSISLDTNANCVDGKSADAGSGSYRHGVSFVDAQSQIAGVDRTRTTYYIRRDQDGALDLRRLRGDRSTTNPSQSIISDQITILDADVIVTNAALIGDEPDGRQPTVTILLHVQGEDGRDHHLQSTITQRILDI